MAAELRILDDRRRADYRSALGTSWRLVADGVMGGISSGRLTPASLEGRSCLRLQGDVRLENNGGFLQAALDLDDGGVLDASTYNGVQLEVYGNGEPYNLHLRTTDLSLPWQAYRASFRTGTGWRTVRLPFADFRGHRTAIPLNPARLRRLGIVAIGRAFTADVCVAGVALYR